MLYYSAWVHLVVVICAAWTVVGHGFVKQVTVDGQVYPGFDPNLDPYQDPIPQRVIRRIPNDGPITDITSADLTCNRLGEPGTTALAEVAPGGTIKVHITSSLTRNILIKYQVVRINDEILDLSYIYNRQWNQWLADHLGPVWTYMASCNGECANLDVSLDKGGKDLTWFKIDAKGYVPSTKRWASQDVIDAGDSWTSTVPKGLKSGQYLVRHEIVALHSNPAQFYPACLQVTVTGSGTSTPDSSDMVAIPGLFNNFIWPDIWAESFSFTIPGPPVTSFDGSTDMSSSWSTPNMAHVTATVGVVGTDASAATPTDDWDGYGDATATETYKSTGATALPGFTSLSDSRRNTQCIIKKNGNARQTHSRRSLGKLSHLKSYLPRGLFVS